MGIDLNVLFNEARQNIFTELGAAGAATLGGIFENGEIAVFMNWLAANGTAKILTEPNVVVLSGRQARFLAGGEFAVPTIVGIGGAAGQTTSFRGFGTSLLVTPTVVDRDLIRIATVAEFSDLNQGAAVNGVPGTSARRVETTVEMREGQTLALAGLLSLRSVVEVTRIPWLGDLPHIGPLLFSSKKASQEENELLILITPEIVRPMDAHEVPPVPGFEVTHPMDHEFYKHNMVEGMPDTGYYQLPPYGSGSVGTNVGYQHFNPSPAGSMYSPQPTNPYGTGFSAPTPIPTGPTYAPGTSPMYAPGASPMYAPPAVPPATPGAQPLQPTPRSMGPMPQGAWTPPPASQTIMPTNYSGPATPASSARTARETQRPGRY
jgi:pilus assembly protein CpaC